MKQYVTTMTTYHSREVEFLKLFLLNPNGLEIIPHLGVSLQVLLPSPLCPNNDL